MSLFRKKAGFTLVEVLLAAAISLIVVLGVGAIFTLSMRSYYKSSGADNALRTTRKIQDHLAREISSAASVSPDNSGALPADMTAYVAAHPNWPVNPVTYSSPQQSDSNGQWYAQIDYRVNLGNALSHTSADATYALTSLSVTLPASVRPTVGDYVMMDSPSFGTFGVQIAAMSPNPLPSPGTDVNVDLTLSESLQTAIMNANGWTDPVQFSTYIPSAQLASGNAVYFQRARRYQVIPDATNPTTAPGKLVWYENTASTTQTVLSVNINPAHLGMFRDTTNATSPDHALAWGVSYLKDASPMEKLLLGGRDAYYTSNDSTGELVSKAETPGAVGFATTSLYAVSIPTTISTTSVTTTTSSTTSTSSVSTTATSTATTTLSSTTTKPTSSVVVVTTTSTPTTTKATTTLSSTTTASTSSVTSSTIASTTKATTTLSTTTKPSTSVTTTSTTKPSTSATTTKTSTTTKASTTASTTSTTKPSTSVTSTTTKPSTTSTVTTTTSSTTTKPSTSVTSSISSTTTKPTTTTTSTTTMPTSTTTVATTSIATTTSVPTTTVSSTTTKPTTSATTTTTTVKTTSTTTTTMPTTTIFDG